MNARATETATTLAWVRNELPAPFTNVIARCGGYSCLAYVDWKNSWRYAFGQEQLLEDVAGWMPLSSVQLDFRKGDYFSSDSFQRNDIHLPQPAELN